MNKMYGVVLIGCGYIGEVHLADIHYRDDVNMIAVVDTKLERARLLARKYGVPEYGTDYRAYILRKDVEIVIIATYVDSHLQILRDSIAAGCHVLCEKPVAASKEAAALFFKEAKEAPTEVLIGHELRYNSSYQRMEKLIRENVIGTLRLIRIIQNHHALNWERYQRLMQDCTPILDCGVHYMDVMRWFSGQEIIRVTGMGCRLDEDAPCLNYGSIQVQLSGGCMGSYESGWSRNLKACNYKEFIGSEGYIRLTLKEDRVSDREEGDLIEVYHAPSGRYEIINNPSVYKNMYAELSELIRRIQKQPRNGIVLEDAYRAFCAAWEAKECIEGWQKMNQVNYRDRRMQQ